MACRKNTMSNLKTYCLGRNRSTTLAITPPSELRGSFDSAPETSFPVSPLSDVTTNELPAHTKLGPVWVFREIWCRFVQFFLRCDRAGTTVWACSSFYSAEEETRARFPRNSTRNFDIRVPTRGRTARFGAFRIVTSAAFARFMVARINVRTTQPATRQ